MKSVGTTRDHQPGSRWLQRLALLTALLVFPLILVGAGVTSKQAGMAFPDWPTSNGHLLNPPGWWQVDATRWEHGHRLIGWAVGVAAIVLAVTAWVTDPRRSVRLLGIGILLAIGVQGIMGGLRVTQISIGWAIVHGIWAQACFSLAVVMTAAASRPWQADASVTIDRRVYATASLTVVVVLGQLVLGALLRHTGRGLVLHAVGAFIVAWMVGWVVTMVFARTRRLAILTIPALGMAAAMVMQIWLGMTAYVFTYSVPVAHRTGLLHWLVPTLHVALGALVLASASVVWAVAASRRAGDELSACRAAMPEVAAP